MAVQDSLVHSVELVVILLVVALGMDMLEYAYLVSIVADDSMGRFVGYSPHLTLGVV